MSMISPEEYFDMYFKNKSPEEIETNLQKLSQEAEELFMKINNNEECFNEPDFKTQFTMNRTYYDYAWTKLREYILLHYIWTNQGQINLLLDVAKIEIYARVDSDIRIIVSNSNGNAIEFNDELIKEIFGTINGNHILWQLLNIDFPEQEEFNNDGYDGSAWKLRVCGKEYKEYKGYNSFPPFIEKIKKILHFHEIFSKSKDQIMLVIPNSYRLKAYDFFKPNDSNINSTDNDKLDLVATMKDKIPANAAWCASFALAWRIFQEKYLKNDFEVTNKNTLIENLIESYSTNIFVNEKDCYTNSGKATEKFKKEIEKAIKKKFKTKSDVLKNLHLSKDENTLDFLIYAIIMFNLEFPKAFEPAWTKLPFGDINGPRVKYFGVTEDSKTKELFKQVQPLFYEKDNEFAVSLSGKDNKQIIIYRTDSCENFEDTFNKVTNKFKENTDVVKVKSFLMPELHLNLTKKYEDLYNCCYISKQDNKQYKITQAIQTLQLDLNNKGAKVKSEAAIIGGETACYIPPESKKDFIFNNTFYLFVVEKESPIIALRVDDIKDFC